jgi:hypothetical protein
VTSCRDDALAFPECSSHTPTQFPFSGRPSCRRVGHDAASSRRGLVVAVIQARVDSNASDESSRFNQLSKLRDQQKRSSDSYAPHSLHLCRQSISNVRAFVGGNPTKKKFNLNRLSRIDTAWWK